VSWRVRPLAAGEIDHELLWGSVAVSAGLLGVLLLTLVGTPNLGCPFKALTGWPCPTCGATRMIDAVAHGRLAAAIRFNPLLAAIALALGPLTIYAWTTVLLRTRRIRLTVSPAGATAFRAAAWLLIAANWAFLIADGR
jgi:hypothetical protein